MPMRIDCEVRVGTGEESRPLTQERRWIFGPAEGWWYIILFGLACAMLFYWFVEPRFTRVEPWFDTSSSTKTAPRTTSPTPAPAPVPTPTVTPSASTPAVPLVTPPVATPLPVKVEVTVAPIKVVVDTPPPSTRHLTDAEERNEALKKRLREQYQID